MIEIDGSFGEGGGQILRSALALSLLTGKAFRMYNIRANRKPKPGLQPQHLMSVRAAATVGSAKIAGDSKGSSELAFEPGAVAAGKYRFAIGTAGATGLVLHTIYLPLALRGAGPSEISLEGGTHVPKAPNFHFNDTTWRAYLEKIGIRIRLEMTRPGFYPRGGGEVIAHIQPCSRIHGLTLTKCSPITRVTGFSTGAGLPDHVARRQARRVIDRLKSAGIKAALEEQAWEGGPGSVVGITLGETPLPTSFYGLGERGKPAEKVADEAVKQVIEFAEAGAPVDEHSADQILLPLAFADGPSEFRVSRITKHLTTSIAVIRMFLDREIICEGEEDSPGTVRIGCKL
jgi:RNA 3'-terminal phosphate cyclase (ATP)